MHLFGDAELDQGLRPQAQVGADRLKIAGQDAFELFNLPLMEKRRLLLRSLPSFPLVLRSPSHPSTPNPSALSTPRLVARFAETMNLIFANCRLHARAFPMLGQNRGTTFRYLCFLFFSRFSNNLELMLGIGSLYVRKGGIRFRMDVILIRGRFRYRVNRL